MLEKYMLFNVPAVVCDGILADAEKAENRIGAKTDGLDVDHFHRKTEIVWLKAGWYDEFFTGPGRHANEVWELDINDEEDLQIGWYTDGGHYRMHSDVNPFDRSHGAHRKVTVVLCLSDDYEGGELELDGVGKMRLIKGQGVAFPSLLAHGVHPVTSGTRITAVKWLTGPFYR